jgi:hypothetical protein
MKLRGGAPWSELDDRRATQLVDARLQCHHAVQLAAAVGISFVPPRPDDSHTNLEWLPALGAIASCRAQASVPFRLAVRPSQFALMLVERDDVRAVLPLHGQTVQRAADWVRGFLPSFGARAEQYTLERHYEIPAHPVAAGAPFDSGDVSAFDQLGRWFSDASVVLETLRGATPTSSAVRCWPHHFDIATLIDVAPGRTVGVGMEPGDQYYAEPYFYVNIHPAPAADAELPLLAGNGSWHRHEWVGAVLPGSRIGPADQRAQIERFIGSAVAVGTRSG